MNLTKRQKELYDIVKSSKSDVLCIEVGFSDMFKERTVISLEKKGLIEIVSKSNNGYGGISFNLKLKKV